MHFEPNAIYHIYNQGNNRQQVFFREENYLYCLRKMRKYLLPYGDLLCYCLMPNHFAGFENAVAQRNRVSSPTILNGKAQKLVLQ